MVASELDLKEKSIELRRMIIKMVYESKAGHLGGSLSWADLGTVLFHNHMNLRGENKDRFILSKGHAVPTLYSILAMVGELHPDSLKTLRHIDSNLEGHPVIGTHPLIYASTGALGQGLSIGIGYSFANKAKNDSGRIYVLLGDGECQEGQIWEAAMSAATLTTQERLSKIIAIIDYNGVQGDNALSKTMPSFEPIADKWKSFGWHVQEIDGHNINQIKEAYQVADSIQDKPSVIIAHTKKGSGISFMEANPVKWHGGSSDLDPELYETALSELGGDNE